MTFPTPTRVLSGEARQVLGRAIHQAAPGSLDLERLQACLWLQLCHAAGVAPEDMKPAGRWYGPVSRTWSKAVATLTGQCSNALLIHQALPTAGRACTLYREALERQAAESVSTPSLF